MLFIKTIPSKIRKNNLLVILFVFAFPSLYAQHQSYRETPAIINRLIHTKLSVNFDYPKRILYGEVLITLKPQFYATDSLLLDANEMEIKNIFGVSGSRKTPLKFTYNGKSIAIQLNRVYNRTETYTVAIHYNTKPVSSGLHFINADEKAKDKPVQVWTDGETNFTSYWCPTLDQPNQKGTLDIQMTVPDKYLTISNGVLVSQHKNPGNTRTDRWKMDMPLSPCLFFMCVGNFSTIADRYQHIPVTYYVEKNYARVAKKIFGNTPEMMALFSRLTGVAYPWPKYAQVVVRDFTSTAMENTSVTVHGEAAQQNDRELADENRWENNIAHELFHQWFGDYVTCESWSNLALNESFASYGTYLWREYKYGIDKADEGNFEDMQAYLSRKREHSRNLVRFYYNDQEDMFDNVSYQKGGCILHMLRKYIGDSAFFKGIRLYLTRNKFSSAEAHQLRLAFEEVTGKDLNVFFNQWFFGNGHPIVDISYHFNDSEKKLSVIIEQNQTGSVFQFPLQIDIYHNGQKTSKAVWASNQKDSFHFYCASMPELVNVDAEKNMLWEKKDHKPLSGYIYQYFHAGRYLDRLEAIKECLINLSEPSAIDLIQRSLSDSFTGIRLFCLQQLVKIWNKVPERLKESAAPVLLHLAVKDSSGLVRSKALELLGTYHKKQYANTFVAATTDLSYSAAGAALGSLAIVDSLQALDIARRLIQSDSKRSLTTNLLSVLMQYGSPADFLSILRSYEMMGITGYKLSVTVPFIHYLAKIRSSPDCIKALDNILALREAIPNDYKIPVTEALQKLSDAKRLQGEWELAQYITSKL